MKVILPTFLLLSLIGCGKIDNPIHARIGELKSVAPLQVNESAVVSLRLVCQAIAQKTPQALVGATAVFNYSRKECADSDVGEVSEVATTIQNMMNGYKFVRDGGAFFYFSDIETADSGSLAHICSSIAGASNVASPLVQGNEVTFFNPNENSADCPGKVNEICIALQKGSVVEGGQARIHTKEWIRINLNNTQGRAGFFTLKRQITSMGCASNQELANSAELK